MIEYAQLAALTLVHPTLLVIWYITIPKRAYSHPLILFLSGAACMILAALSKIILTLVNDVLRTISANANEVNSFISTNAAAITAIEISTAAVGGSLVAAAIFLKAQILHNRWKVDTIKIINDKKGRLKKVEKSLIVHSGRKWSMTEDQFAEDLNHHLEIKHELTREIKKLEEEISRRGII